MCDKLMIVDKMKSDFFSSMSHELRTPLTSIKEGISLLKEGVGGTIPDRAEAAFDHSHPGDKPADRTREFPVRPLQNGSGNDDLYLYQRTSRPIDRTGHDRTGPSRRIQKDPPRAERDSKPFPLSAWTAKGSSRFSGI